MSAQYNQAPPQYGAVDGKRNSVEQEPLLESSSSKKKSAAAAQADWADDASEDFDVCSVRHVMIAQSLYEGILLGRRHRFVVIFGNSPTIRSQGIQLAVHDGRLYDCDGWSNETGSSAVLHPIKVSMNPKGAEYIANTLIVLGPCGHCS